MLSGGGVVAHSFSLGYDVLLFEYTTVSLYISIEADLGKKRSKGYREKMDEDVLECTMIPDNCCRALGPGRIQA